MTLVSIHSTVKGIRVPRQKLLQLGEVILGAGRRSQKVNLIFVADREMRQLNRRYRGKDKTTDVLSFHLDGDDDGLFGEIYISVAQARRNARKEGKSLRSEILLLFCHGLLHLCGIHHPTDAARRRMKRLEDKYLGQIDGIRS